MADPALSLLSSELEDAGLVGGAAAAMLGFIAFGDDRPGFLSATETGAVWTKSITNAPGREADLGIAKLVFEGGSVAATAGFAFDDKGLDEFSLLLEVEGANTASMLALEFDTKHAFLAPAKKQNDQIVGYTDRSPLKPLRLPLPASAGVEFTIKRTNSGVLSSVTLHGAPAGISGFANGIFRFDLGDEVLVLPKMGKLGLSIKDLFLDISASGATPVSGLFPEVYDPSWTGLGAKSIGVHYPIDKGEDEWLNASLGGFLIGFDGKVSLKGQIGFTSSDSTKRLLGASGEIDIRADEVIKGALDITLNLEKAAKSVDAAAKGTNTQGLSTAQQDLVTTAQNDTATATAPGSFSLGGKLKCRAQLIRIPLASNDDIFGFDLSLEAIESDGNPAGLIIQGTAARALLWLGLGGGAISLLKDGIENNNGLKAAGGIGLTFLLICDVGDFLTNASPRLLPKLDRLEIRKLGYRYVNFPAEGGNPEKTVHQILLDVVIAMSFDGTLADLILALAGRGIDTAQSFGKLFAKTSSEIEVKGPLELEISNYDISFEVTSTGTEMVSEVDERVRRVAGQKDLQFKPRKFPAISLKSPPSSSSSKIPKPITKTSFVTKEVSGTTQYGLSIQLTGLENPDFKLESPFVLGVMIYFSPKFGLEFEASLIIEPRFRFAIPYWVLVDGAFELDKPVPGFDAVQNRISVDVGLFNNKLEKGTSITADNLGKLNDIANYDYRFGGTVAWGEAFRSDPARRVDFLFVEAHYDGASPFLVIGPVGIYGLAGLFGKNVAPGVPGDARDASAIASWIEGNGQSFDNVLNWPSIPTTSTWHPAKNSNDDDPLIVAGLKVRAGPVGSRTVDVEGLLMLGLYEFWLAAAGRVKIKAANFEGTAIVVYDDPSKSFALRLRFNLKFEANGEEILSVSGPIEITSGSNGFRVSVGHFQNERGGPLVAKLLKDLFQVQFYAVYDSERQDDFGFALPGMGPRPDLGKKAFSQGMLFQYGPKQIGPNSINITIHAAAGYNFGLADDPFMIVGEMFLSGGLHVKVLFVKVGFTLSAVLAGRLTSGRLDFEGRIAFVVGMPWPISDVKVSFPFGFTLGNGPVIPEPLLSSQVFGLTHSEPKAEEFPASGIPILPIDAVIGLRFNRPIVGIYEGANTATELPDIDPINQIDTSQPQNRPYVEIIDTNLDGNTYQIEYEHYLSDVRITHRPVSDGAEVVVPSMFASWEIPASYDDGTGSPDPTDKNHRAIYLNTLLQPGLDFAPENLGKFLRGQVVEGVLPPCKKPERVCLIQGKPTNVEADDQTGLSRAWRPTEYGSISVSETGLPPAPSPILVQNLSRLAWTGSVLLLPGEVRIDVPPARRVTGEVELHTLASRLTGATLITLDTHLANLATPVRLVMIVTHEPSRQCALDLKVSVLPSLQKEVKLDARVVTCSKRGEIAIAFEVTALKPNVRLRRMTLRGPQLIPPGTGNDGGTDEPNPGRWLKLAGELRNRQRFFLNQLCFETFEAGHSAWETTTQTFGNGPPTDATIDQFIGNLLLEPNREYRVSYRVQSFGRSNSDSEGSDKINSEDDFSESSGLSKDLRTVRFRTEDAPSQPIERYVGFTYPGPKMAPVYPRQTIPMVTFRNNGLIKRIYKAHKGADVLKPVVRDLDGNALATVSTGSLTISSGAASEVMEGLIGECLGAAQGFTKVQLDIFERVLEPDMNYSLSVEDTTAPATEPDDLPPYRSAFKTSRHLTFADHVSAANALLSIPVQLPILGVIPSQILAPIFTDVASGTLAGYDELVEAIYRRALGHETGRLTEEFGRAGDVAANMVTSVSGGQPSTFGIALEMEEPLLGKEGVGFNGTRQPVPPALRNKGIEFYRIGSRRFVTVRDLSGSRILVFASSDAASFAPILSPVQLPVAFDGELSIRAAVTAYVEVSFAALPEAQRTAHINSVISEIRAIPEMAGGLDQASGALQFNSVGGP